VLFAAAFLAFAAAPAALAAPHRSAETTLLQAINTTRAAHGLRPLHVDLRLRSAARFWSTSLLRSNTFTHGDFAGRMSSFDLHGSLGENLAWGGGRYATAQGIVSMWMASPGHRANLLRPGYTRVGIGIVQGTFQGQGGSSVVTADFGA
jgi:uncharacterized protein YkwD